MSALFRRLGRLVRSSFLSSDSPTTSSENYTDWHPPSGHSSGTAGPPPPVSAEAAYYAALELPEKAPFEEIKKAYKSLMKKYHPDRFHNEPEKKKYAEAVTQKINEAYAYFEKKYGK